MNILVLLALLCVTTAAPVVLPMPANSNIEWPFSFTSPDYTEAVENAFGKITDDMTPKEYMRMIAMISKKLEKGQPICEKERDLWQDVSVQLLTKSDSMFCNEFTPVLGDPAMCCEVRAKNKPFAHCVYLHLIQDEPPKATLKRCPFHTDMKPVATEEAELYVEATAEPTPEVSESLPPKLELLPSLFGTLNPKVRNSDEIFVDLLHNCTKEMESANNLCSQYMIANRIKDVGV